MFRPPIFQERLLSALDILFIVHDECTCRRIGSLLGVILMTGDVCLLSPFKTKRLYTKYPPPLMCAFVFIACLHLQISSLSLRLWPGTFVLCPRFYKNACSGGGDGAWVPVGGRGTARRTRRPGTGACSFLSSFLISSYRTALSRSVGVVSVQV